MKTFRAVQEMMQPVEGRSPSRTREQCVPVMSLTSPVGIGPDGAGPFRHAATLFWNLL